MRQNMKLLVLISSFVIFFNIHVAKYEITRTN